MLRTLRVLVPSVVVMLVAGSAGAELGPAKPSQLVTILSGSTPCGASSSGKAIDSVRNGGPPLAIPPKQVLVVTDVEVHESGLAPGESEFLAFDLEPEDRNYFSIRLTADANGVVSGSRHMQSGIVVESGSTICSFQTNAFWTLRGYFAKDK